MRAVLVPVFVVAALLLGCGDTSRDTGSKSEESKNHAIPAPNAKILDDSSLAALEGIDDATWTFSETTAILQDVEAGDVLIVGPTPLAPYGALRKVETIEERGGGLVFQTTQALLTEAFEELEIRLQTSLDGANPEALHQPLGGSLGQRSQPLGLAFPFRLSSQSEGGTNQVDLSGSLALDPSFDLTIDLSIVEFQLKELSMEFGATETFAADLFAKGSETIDERLTVGEIWFTPIILIVPIPFPPGTIPVVLTPKLSIVAGIQGKAEGEFTASVHQSAGFTAGLGYKGGRFGAYASTHSDFHHEEPVYEGSASVKAYAGPQLAVLLYGLVGPFAGVDAFVDLHATLQGPPPCARGVVDAGLTGKIGVDFIASYSTVLFDKRFPIAAFDGCSEDPSAPRPAITWARSFGRHGSHGEIAKAVVQAHDGTYFVAGDSGLFEGVTAFGASMWVMRLDALGNIVWQRAFERSTGLGLVQGVQEVPAGFLVALTSGVMALDSGGNILWIRAIQADGTLEIASIAAQPDGSFLLAGRHPTRGVSWAMSLDPEGEVRWSRRYPGEALTRVRATRDGGAIVLANDGVSPILTKLRGDGEIEWARSIRNDFDTRGGLEDEALFATSDEYAFDLAQKPDGGFLVVGRGYSNFPIPEPGPSGFYAPTVFELSPEGALTSALIHRSPLEGSYGAAYAVGVHPNGNAVIVGRYAERVEDLLKKEKVLVIQGSNFDALGGSGNDTIYAGNLGGLSQGMPLALTEDGGSVVATTSNSFDPRDQFWIVKLNRTAGIRFPFRERVAGGTYQNPHAKVSERVASSSPLPATALRMITRPKQEETPLRLGAQTP